MFKATRLIVFGAAALLVAACGSDGGGDTDAGTTDHNKADVRFAQEMIPHHDQAIVMSKVARKQAKTAELRQLAARIQAAQGPEIEQMSGWLEAWSEEAPSARGGMGGMRGDRDHPMGDMDDGGMAGMMSDEQMMNLDDAQGSRFDRMWLLMMIEHHEGAVEMAKVEQRNGMSEDAVDLAKEIETAQTEEIALMKLMLRS